MATTRKVHNIICKVTQIDRSTDEQGAFETLLAVDENGKTYAFSFREGWANYSKYNESDIILIRSARCFEASPSLNFLYYLRIKH